ncbi:MAG: hypothetical protein ABIH26_06565 [Candidatus Eisenbacteria bacterium]
MRCGLCRRIVRLVSAIVFIVTIPSQTAGAEESADPSDRERNTLLQELAAIFKQENPKIERVAILDLRSFFYDYGHYAFVGWGIVEDGAFRGDPRGELFGVFVADPGLTRITEVLEITPTPRWQDYGLYIESVGADSIVVTGEGLSYRDDPVRRAYAWHPYVNPRR